MTMKRCGCKWDGALDGRLIRCADHQRAYKVERQVEREVRKQVAELKSKGG